jgi:hypothetical protein
MKMKSMNQWLFLGALTLVAFSCGSDDDPEPPKVHGANFETEVATTGEGKKIIFKNTSANAESAFWSFGDGATSQEMSPTHVYEAPGTYPVTLVSIGIENSEPVSSIKTLDLVVTLPPILLCDVKPAASNYIKNGEFESNANWTVNSMSDAGLVNAVYAFGSETNPACASTGKGFHIDNLTPFANNGNLIWQSLGTLPVGKYRFSGDVNIKTGESQTPDDASAGKNYFIEAFLLTAAPPDTKSLSAAKAPNATLISGFNAWWGGATNDIPAGKGSFPVIAYPFEDVTTLIANNRGEFEITESKEYFFAMQFGTYGGSYGAGGISLDNFAIIKMEE